MQDSILLHFYSHNTKNWTDDIDRRPISLERSSALGFLFAQLVKLYCDCWRVEIRFTVGCLPSKGGLWGRWEVPGVSAAAMQPIRYCVISSYAIQLWRSQLVYRCNLASTYIVWSIIARLLSSLTHQLMNPDTTVIRNYRTNTYAVSCLLREMEPSWCVVANWYR